MSRPEHRRAKLVALIGSIARSRTPARQAVRALVGTERRPDEGQARPDHRPGTLVGYAELDYPPQSIKVEGAQRAATTKCLPNQMTAAEATGFDVETTKLVAKGLGVEACFVQPSWTEVTSGGWGDRFDLVYGSGAINATRMEHLWMTVPYYYVPQRFVVPVTSTAKTASDLDGEVDRDLHELHGRAAPKGTLSIPGVDLTQKVKNPKLCWV